MIDTGTSDDRTGGADYGFDAPYVPFFQVFGGLALIGFSFIRLNVFSLMSIVAGVLFLAMAASFVYATRRGKFAVWAELLDGLALRGDERVLDVGCGRGAVLIAVAKRLDTGRAVGLDLWRSRDQSGNAEQTTLRNAAAENVTDKIELRTGDMSKMPLPDDEFDLVTSSLAIHNLGDAAARAAAVREAFRVLRPGGRLLIADIAHTEQYRSVLAELDATEIHRRGLGPRLWYSGPWTPTTLVSAAKPNRPA